MSFNSKTDTQSWYDHLVENYTTKKTNAVLPHATSCMTKKTNAVLPHATSCVNLTKLSKTSEKKNVSWPSFIKVQK